MKTTIDIADPLMEQARQIAAEQGTTVRALVESGLRRVIADQQLDRGFRLRRVTFKGDGLLPELEGAPWQRILELAYEGRGA
jgi:hypothetical protein